MQRVGKVIVPNFSNWVPFLRSAKIKPGLIVHWLSSPLKYFYEEAYNVNGAILNVMLHEAITPRHRANNIFLNS